MVYEPLAWAISLANDVEDGVKYLAKRQTTLHPSLPSPATPHSASKRNGLVWCTTSLLAITSVPVLFLFGFESGPFFF